MVDGGGFDGARATAFLHWQRRTGLSGLNFWETFGDLAYTTYGHAVGLRDLGPTMAPMNAYLTITGIEPSPCAWPGIARTPPKSPVSSTKTAAFPGLPPVCGPSAP